MVDRFRPYYVDPAAVTGHNATMRQNSTGDWVRFSDYDAAAAEYEEYRKCSALESGLAEARIAELEAIHLRLNHARTDLQYQLTDSDKRVGVLEGALNDLLPGLILDLRYAEIDDDKDAMESRIKTVTDALEAPSTPAERCEVGITPNAKEETKCEKCEGSGETGHTWHDGTQYSDRNPPCVVCGGTGIPVICEDCPPSDYPTEATRCAPCPRRQPAEQSIAHVEAPIKGEDRG